MTATERAQIAWGIRATVERPAEPFTRPAEPFTRPAEQSDERIAALLSYIFPGYSVKV